MAITPQTIKDQEFQIKFRGYDTVEVKAYHDLIAEEFFDLFEQVREQKDELDLILDERNDLLAEKTDLERQLSALHGDSEEIRSECVERDNELLSLRREIDQLKEHVVSLEEQLLQKDEASLVLEDQLKDREAECRSERERGEKLQQKIDALEMKNEQLRSEEIDFKSTLVAAQKFTSDLKLKSEEEAQAIVQAARDEAEQLRQETFSELAKYPAEIERLKEQRGRVRDELEQILRQYLAKLEMFDHKEDEEDYGELFQKLVFDEEGEPSLDEFDGMKMDFSLVSDDSAAKVDFVPVDEQESSQTKTYERGPSNVIRK